MFKHANTYAPGDKVTVTARNEREKIASVKTGVVENMDTEGNAVYVRADDGTATWHPLHEVVPAGG